MAMAKRSHKIPELKEKTESKCKWGLFTIFESCQGRRASRKLISNGRRTSKRQIIEYPRKSDQLTRFDEECQRFQEHIPSKKLMNRELKSKRESESKLVDDHLMESQGKMSSPKAHKPFFKETPLKKVTFAELLRTVSPNNDDDNSLAEPAIMPEDLRRSFSARKHDAFDEINRTNRLVPMNVRALVDQMFMERRLKDRLNSECKSFSEALEVLNTAKNPRRDRKEREASKAISNEEEEEEDSLRKSNFTAQPKSKNHEYSEDISLRCSSLRCHHESDSFSFRKMKKGVKRRFVGPKGPGPLLTCSDSYVLPQNGSPASEVGNEVLVYGPEIKSCVDRKTKERLDFRGFDVILEAKRHLSSRLENVSASETCTRQPRTLGRILQSPEHDFRPIGLSLKEERHLTCLSPSRQNREVSDREESRVLIPGSSCQESHDNAGQSKLVIPKSTRGRESNNSEADSDVNRSAYAKSDSIISQSFGNKTENSIAGSVSGHEESRSKASTIQLLEIADASKYQEEHRSPVSVLELITEDANSPRKTTSQKDEQALQPLRLDFEERPNSEHYCIEERDNISPYVQSVLQASSLNWDYLSEIELIGQETELVAESLFDDVEFPLTDRCYFDPKLLFDRINEVLLYLYDVYCCSPPLVAFEEPRIKQVELEKVVIDEVMTQAEFFILPRTERRTLDQLVSKDVRKCRSWLDVRRDTEQIVIDISADVLEDSIVDILLVLRV